MQLPVSLVWVGGREGGGVVVMEGRPDGQAAVQDAVLLQHLVLFIKATWLKREPDRRLSSNVWVMNYESANKRVSQRQKI